MNSLSKDIVGVFLAPMILGLLKQNDSYGYELVRNIKELTNGRLTPKEGVIYPVLQKMEKKSWIKSAWNFGEDQRPRKYYTILQEGVVVLDSERMQISELVKILDKLYSENA